MAKQVKGFGISKHFIGVVAVLIPVFILVSSGAVFYRLTHSKILPGVRVAGVDVGGLTKPEARALLIRKVKYPKMITLAYNSTEKPLTYNLPLASFNFGLDSTASAEKAYEAGRGDNLIDTVISLIKWSRTGIDIAAQVTYNEEKLASYLSVVAEQVTSEPVYPSMNVSRGVITVDQGISGTTLDADRLKNEILRKLTRNSFTQISISTQTIDPTVNDVQAVAAQERAESYLKKAISLKIDFDKYYFDQTDIFESLDPRGGYYEKAIEDFISNLSESVDRPSQNPNFVFSNGRVQEFAPALDGLAINREQLASTITKTLDDLSVSDINEIEVEIPVSRVAPDFQTSEVNDLGIKELIGKGTSKFRGSISSRVYNINLAASKFNGVLIKPGEVFSFNKTVGDISKLTGYKEAYIIQGGKTILGDGGGVCQVSTTFFRAALNAGLPIVDRRAHSYRVGYYEQDSKPGIDATIYVPTVDLKIKNDTPAHILIQAKADTVNMTLEFEFYGTSDGRVATVSTPVITSTIPPLPDEYTDDPTLPAGTIKQVDYRAAGAKVRFNYSVKRDGETIYDETFYSNYRPWSAKFLRGTGPV